MPDDQIVEILNGTTAALEALDAICGKLDINPYQRLGLEIIAVGGAWADGRSIRDHRLDLVNTLALHDPAITDDDIRICGREVLARLAAARSDLLERAEFLGSGVARAIEEAPETAGEAIVPQIREQVIDFLANEDRGRPISGTDPDVLVELAAERVLQPNLDLAS